MGQKTTGKKGRKTKNDKDNEDGVAVVNGHEGDARNGDVNLENYDKERDQKKKKKKKLAVNDDGEVGELGKVSKETHLVANGKDLGDNAELETRKEKKKKQKDKNRVEVVEDDRMGEKGDIPEKKQKEKKDKNRIEVVEDDRMGEKGDIPEKKQKEKKRIDVVEDDRMGEKGDIPEMKNAEEEDKRKKKKKKRKREREGDDIVEKDSKTNGEDVGKVGELADGKMMEKVDSAKKKRKRENKNHSDDLGSGLQESIAEKPSGGSMEIKDHGGNAHSSRNKTGNRKTHGVDVGSNDKEKKKSKNKKIKKTKSDKDVSGENSTHRGKSKKVSFSDHVEVFPSSDGPRDGKMDEDEGLVRGKRFSLEEDAMVRKAVDNYIDLHGLGDEGIEMILHCKSHPELRHCWKEIGAALPWRPYESVYYRAHILFERGNDRKWTQEEYELIRNFHEKHGADWKMLADALGKHRFHVKDTWRRIRLPNRKKGRWSQEEYQNLFDLVNLDLRMKSYEEKKSKHGMLRDNIAWEAISDKISTRTNVNCCHKWYDQLTSPLVAEGLWADADDYRLLDVLFSLDACCTEDVDWDNLVEHRSGDVCRKRWDQMVKHLGEHGNKSFAEQVEVLSKRYRGDMLEAREIYDNKPVVS